MSPSSATFKKARDYLQHELVDVACEDGILVFRVRGRTGNWTVRAEDGRLFCDCPSFRRRCSHVVVGEMLTDGRRRR
jgi:hypothetical protein